MRPLALASICLAACAAGPTTPGKVDRDDAAADADTADAGRRDADNDGSPDKEDCADDDASIYPGAVERCDGMDNNCDGQQDEDLLVSRYRDEDGDGYGDSTTHDRVCPDELGWVEDVTDCNDADSAVHPGAADTCNSADDDCDGLIDEDGTGTIYHDADGDGYGDDDSVATGCAGGLWSSTGGDCDDEDATVNPAATEICNAHDDDCDGTADSASVCPCDVQHWPDTEHPYLYCTTATDWTSAQNSCDSYGYALVTFDSADEGLWVESVVYSYTDNYWWVGHTDAASEGSWVWADGSPVTYTNWSSGEPNNSHGRECYDSSEEDCAMIKWSGASWNDYPCECTKPYYVCEGASELRPNQ